MRIAVYCSAKTDLPEQVRNDARRLGEWIGRNGHQLVYGGLSRGLMHEVAQGARDAGAIVMGVVPETRLANIHPANTVNLMCATLHERKQMMEENADVFVALDGGLGTLDEVFAALASMTFFNEPKPIFMLNRDGLFDPIRQLMGKLMTRGLATPPATSRIRMVPDIDALEEALAEAGAQIDERNAHDNP
ncbi:MAG: TIGR00730 family Rossman fold protein [Muribaculaceae bacterium]|nr:TIGR00730 family Rossman fold protein [Muribaculaceae bacterium]